MNNEQSLAANEKTNFVLAVRMFVQEFLPKRVLFRMIRVHADDVVSLETAFADEPVNLGPVCGDDCFVVGIICYFSVSFTSLNMNPGGAHLIADYIHIFAGEKRILAI